MKGDEESIRRTLGLYGTVENVAFRFCAALALAVMKNELP